MLTKHESIFSSSTFFNNIFCMILMYGRYMNSIILLFLKWKCTLKFKSVIVYYMSVKIYLIQIASFSVSKTLHYIKNLVHINKILMRGWITIISDFVLWVQCMQVKSLNKPVYNDWAELNCIHLYCHTNMIEENPFKANYSIHMPY